MTDVDRITNVRVATILHTLEVPIHFGTWIMRHREFALARIDSESGLHGFAYCLTRDVPVAALAARSIGPPYVGEPIHDPARLFFKALWMTNSVHASGIVMRALSSVDLASWMLS